jgi:glycosyltransferase involved in cell wall biosynthesis
MSPFSAPSPAASPDQRRLKVGYIMQANAADMSTVSGPQLHVKAVVDGLGKRGHQVRMVAIQRDRTLWTDDIQTWHAGEFSWSAHAMFRMVESVVRGVQSRVRAPFFRAFDSVRFSDACVSAFKSFDLLYERDGMMCYGGLIAAKRLGIPLVVEANGDLVEEWRQLGLQMSKGQWAAVHWVTRHFYRNVTHIVAVGDMVKERLVQRWGLDPAHVSVVRNGAEVDLFLEAVRAEGLCGRFGIGPGPVVIFTGSFQPWHGVDLIFEAFRLVAAISPEAQMVFIGDGGLRPELEERVRRDGLERRVVFTGRVSHHDVASLLQSADVAAIYHRLEAADIVETPLKLFEYMAAGRAIIAPDVPNMRRILTDGVNARLVPPDQPQALAAVMLGLLNDSELRTRLGRAAREEATTKHSWSRAVRELEDVFAGVLRRCRG